VNVEKYLVPSELAYELSQLGFSGNVKFYRALRRYARAIDDTPFVGKAARMTEVIEWIKRHPEFRHTSRSTQAKIRII
jgi:hypothetical protein